MDTNISSGLRITFLAHFIVALIFGLAFLLLPGQTGSLYGMQIPQADIYRLLGAALLGYAASSWLCYQESNWESVRIVVFTEILWTLLGTLVMLNALLLSGFPALGWINALIFAAFCAAFSWFYFRR
jgi:hypothetical protein